MTIVETQQVGRIYQIGGRTLHVLQDVSLKIVAEEFVAAVGSSGKSMLLSLLLGLDSPANGRILIQKNDITDLSEDGLTLLHNDTIYSKVPLPCARLPLIGSTSNNSPKIMKKQT
ncbi:MAG: ATP-binding cassette domain-containing protein [Chloroflexota bacterium]